MNDASSYASGGWLGNPFASRSNTPVQNPFSSPEPRGADMRSNPFQYKGAMYQEPLGTWQPGAAYAAAYTAGQQPRQDIGGMSQQGMHVSSLADAYFAAQNSIPTYPVTAGAAGPSPWKPQSPLNASHAAGMAGNVQHSLLQQQQQAGYNPSVPYDQHTQALANQQILSPQQQQQQYARSAAYAPQHSQQNSNLRVEMLSRGGSITSSIPTAAPPEVTSPPGTPDSMSALQQHWQHVQQQQQQMLQDPQRLAARPAQGQPGGASHPMSASQEPPYSGTLHPAAGREQQQQWPSRHAAEPHTGLPDTATAAAAYRPSHEQQPAYISSSTGWPVGYSPEPPDQPSTQQQPSRMGVNNQQTAARGMPAVADSRPIALSGMQHRTQGGGAGLGNQNAAYADPQQYLQHQQGQFAAQQQHKSQLQAMAHPSGQLQAAVEGHSSAHVAGVSDGGVGSDNMPGTPFAASADRPLGYPRDSSSAGTTGSSTDGGLQMVVGSTAAAPAAVWQQDVAGFGSMMPAAAAARLQLIQQQQQEQEWQQQQERQAEAQRQAAALVALQQQQQLAMLGLQTLQAAAAGSSTAANSLAAAGNPMFGGMMPMVPAMLAAPALMHPMYSPGMLMGQMPCAMAAAPGAGMPGYNPWLDPRVMQAAASAAAAAAAGYGLQPAAAAHAAGQPSTAGTATDPAAGGDSNYSLPGTTGGAAYRASSDGNDSLALTSKGSAGAALATADKHLSLHGRTLSSSDQRGGWDSRSGLHSRYTPADWLLGGLLGRWTSAAAAPGNHIHPGTDTAGALIPVKGLGQGLVMRAAGTAANSVLAVGCSTAAAAQSMMMAVVWCGHYQLVLILYIMLAMTASVIAAQRAMWGAAGFAVSTAFQFAGLTMRELRLFTAAAAKVAWADLQHMPMQLLDQPWLQLQQQGKGTEAAALVMQQLPAPEALQDNGLLESFRGLLLLGRGAGGSSSSSAADVKSPAPATALADTAAQLTSNGTQSDTSGQATQSSAWSWGLFGGKGASGNNTSSGLETRSGLAAPALADGAAADHALSRVGSTALARVSSAGLVASTAAAAHGSQPGALLVAVDSMAVMSGMWVGLGLKLWGLATIRLPYETARIWGSATWHGARMSIVLSRAAGYYVFRLIWCLLHISLIISAHARSHVQLPYSTAIAAAVPVVRRVSAVTAQALLLWWKHIGGPMFIAAGLQLVTAAGVVPGGVIGVQLLQALLSICLPAVYAAVQGVYSAVHWFWTADDLALKGSDMWQVVMQGMGFTVSAAVWFSTHVVAQAEKILAVLVARVLQGAPPMAQAAVWGSAGMLKRLVVEISQQAWLLVLQMYQAWLLQQQQEQGSASRMPVM